MERLRHCRRLPAACQFSGLFGCVRKNLLSDQSGARPAIRAILEWLLGLNAQAVVLNWANATGSALDKSRYGSIN